MNSSGREFIWEACRLEFSDTTSLLKNYRRTVQKRATRMICGLENLPYSQILKNQSIWFIQEKVKSCLEYTYVKPEVTGWMHINFAYHYC